MMREGFEGTPVCLHEIDWFCYCFWSHDCYISMSHSVLDMISIFPHVSPPSLSSCHDDIYITVLSLPSIVSESVLNESSAIPYWFNLRYSFLWYSAQSGQNHDFHSKIPPIIVSRSFVSVSVSWWDLTPWLGRHVSTISLCVLSLTWDSDCFMTLIDANHDQRGIYRKECSVTI